MTKSAVHNHYVQCSCGAEYSDTLPACLACKKANPELPTLNASEEPADESTAKTEPAPTPGPAPTLNGKDE